MVITAGELANLIGARVEGDPSAQVSGVSSPERAGANDLIYLDAPKHQERAAASRARCVAAHPGVRLAGKTVLEAANPKLAFAKAGSELAAAPLPRTETHATAIIAADARVEANVSIGPYVVIEPGAEIGSGTMIEAFCYIGHGARVGENCRLHPRVTLYEGARVGNRVEIHSGAVIGSDGFGYVFGEGRQWKFPQVGELVIGDDVEIGANSTIDRGSLETTEIGRGVKIDNLVQIAHNVQIGGDSVVAAQTGISGSTTIGRQVVAGGQVGIADHCRIEDGAMLGAQAGIPSGKTIRAGQLVWGTPARPLDRFKEQYAHAARLPELVERVRRLERKLAGE
jgi:UDP-3-O-[3-hydroxymyristoyl] glucosamine N-acyltransferase